MGQNIYRRRAADLAGLARKVINPQEQDDLLKAALDYEAIANRIDARQRERRQG